MKKKIPRTLYYIFLAVGIMLTLYNIYLGRNKRYEEREVVGYIIIGLALAAVICWLIDRAAPKNFGVKSTRGEIEKQIHRE